MTEGNVSPLLDFPSILPPCLPEVPAGISEGYDTHSFIHMNDDSIHHSMMILSYAGK